LPDELLSGWLSRLAAANYCDDAELLAHIEIDTTHGASLDFNVDAAAAEKISDAARTNPDIVRSLTFPTMTPAEALLTVLPDEFELVSIWTETLTLMLCRDRATRRGRRRGFA
jgi:hypothetical protein